MFRRGDPGTASPHDWDGVERVLCVRLDSLGDVLMTTPAIRALRAPGRHITLLTSSAGAEAAALVPEVDEVIVHDAAWVTSAVPPLDPGPDLRLIERLYRGRFDAAVIFTVYSQTPFPAATVCHLAGIPRRLAHAREKSYGLITDWIPDPEPHELVRHEVRRQLDLVAAVGCRTDDERLSLRIPAVAEHEAARLLEDAGVTADRPWAVVHPGATAPSRRWPEEHYVEACRRLTSDFGWLLLFTGGPDEIPLLDRIRARLPDGTASLGGRLSLATLAAVLRRAPLVVANNTGPVHVAAAVGTPVVVLYALTNPQHTPWGVPSAVLSHDVPCRWCHASVCPEGHHACLRLVGPEEVVSAALRLAPSSASRADRAQGSFDVGGDHAPLAQDPR